MRTSKDEPLSRKRCDWCEERLTQGEAKDPWRDDGKGEHILCYECWRNECTFDCCKCGDIEDDEHQDEIGCLVVIADAEAGVPSGLYKITDHPYYGGPMIGAGYVFPEALKRIGDIPEGAKTDPYPMGHLCRRCARKAKRDARRAVTA